MLWIKAHNCLWLRDFQIMNRYYSWRLQFLNSSNLCKITIRHVLGGAVSSSDKIILVLPIVGFPLMTKKWQIPLILRFTPEVSGVLLQLLFKEPWGSELLNMICAMTHTGAICHQNGKSKQNMSLQYTCLIKETTENGMMLKKYHCMSLSLVKKTVNLL